LTEKEKDRGRCFYQRRSSCEKERALARRKRRSEQHRSSWLWSEDAYYFTATKQKKKKRTFSETTTTTTTILHDFAFSHQRDIRLKATTLSSTKSRILASTTTTMREPYNPGYHVRQDDGRNNKNNDDLLKEFRELHTEEENICRD
jgi:hypothetical protein